MDFEKSVSVVDVALVLHNMSDWDRFKVETSCLMAKRDQLVNMFQEKEIAEHEKFQLREEKHHYQQQLGQMVEKMEVRSNNWIVFRSTLVTFWNYHTSCGESLPGCATIGYGPQIAPVFGVRTHPRDEGTYEQWKFQVNGMRSLCTEPVVRSALITSLRGEASELIGFVGFGAPLGAILEAMDKRFGKRSTTDRL